MAVTACPSRLLAEAPWAEEFVEWWVWSIEWDINGRPIGLPKWPLQGGLRRQPRRLFEACKLLRLEWPYVSRGRVKPPPRDDRAQHYVSADSDPVRAGRVMQAEIDRGSDGCPD